jgi:hypothetical protein
MQNDLQISSETAGVAVAVRQRTRSTFCSCAKRAILRYSGLKLAPHYKCLVWVNQAYLRPHDAYLRDTMRFVDSKQRDGNSTHHIYESLIIQSRLFSQLVIKKKFVRTSLVLRREFSWSLIAPRLLQNLTVGASMCYPDWQLWHHDGQEHRLDPSSRQSVEI